MMQGAVDKAVLEACLRLASREAAALDSFAIVGGFLLDDDGFKPGRQDTG